jgi:iron(III) transport system ATP-binding protein
VHLPNNIRINSGGQQQRVALARALAPKPLLLLLDEPFSNLDAELRESLSLEVRALLKAENTTAILVTHDQHEAFAMADYVGVMYNGQIEQWASPYELYHQPSSRHIAQFIGEGVLVAGKRCSDDGRIALELGEIGIDVCPCEAGEEVDVLIRPDDIIHDDNSPMQAKVLAKAFRGAEFLYTLELSSGTKVLSLVPSHHNHQLGEMIGIKLALDHTVAFVKTRI